MMDERLRQEYLHRLGIQSYFPRHPLPGAAASVIAVPVLPEEIISSPEPAVAPEKSREIQSKLASLVPEVPQESEQKDTAEEDQVKNPGEQQQAQEEVRFQLAFIRVSDELLALVLLPHVQDTRTLNPAQKALFSNLCQALNLPLQALDFSIKAFRWPFSEAGFLDKSEAAARAALDTYLSQLHEDIGFTHLLLLGTNIAHLLAEFQHQIDGEFVVCRSLDEMLKLPALKAETWQTLKKLAIT